MIRLTEKQKHVLLYLQRHVSSGPHPSGHMRNGWIPNPGDVLKRLEQRGLTESNGVVTPEGKVYAITDAGRAALK